MRGSRHLAALWLGLQASGLVLAGGDCTRTSVGLTPLNDLGAGSYQGFTGGLYPGGSNVRPAAHDEAADEVARVLLRDAAGIPDAVSGRTVLLTIGMSNTSQESQRFLAVANADPTRNTRVTLVNGAQGGWTGAMVADPSQNAPFWSTVDSRLAAAGVTAAQVGAIWLKEAERQPTQPFPADAQILQGNLEEIARIIHGRFPNARQIYMSSRIYAGYATTPLNPEPYAYQSGFSVKWMIEGQLAGAPALNFDPRRGEVRAPWLGWGPYTWADGLTPRSDGMIWECADFGNDGTHPSASGATKVAGALLDFFHDDPVASRWFGDCDANDPGSFSVPPRVLDLGITLDSQAGTAQLTWQSLGAASGPGTRYDLAAGSLGDMRQSGGFAGATCAMPDIAASSVSDPVANPAMGDGVYYLVRGKNSCGAGTYGEPGALAGPRGSLDLASPCPGSLTGW